MALDQLPDAIVVPDRDTVAGKYLRDYKLRLPQADTSKGTQPWIDGQTHADTSMALYGLAVQNGTQTTLDGLSGTQLEDQAEREGQPRRLPAVGGSGFVVIEASSGGGTIYLGDVLVDEKTGFRFKSTNATGAAANGDLWPVAGLSTGPSTNLAAGTRLKWVVQRPGIGATANVFENGAGEGLADGRDQESDPEIRERIRAVRANPPASGNDPDYQDAIRKTPGVPVQQPFIYPSINGASTVGYCFTVRPSVPGGSRVPTPTQMAAVLAHITPDEPGDDSIFECALINWNIDVAFVVTWATDATWTDPVPWPRWAPTTPVAVTITTVPTASSFSVTTAGTPAVGGSQPAPVPGNTIAFFNPSTRRFSRKKVLSVTNPFANIYTITCDLSNGATDPDYVPLIGQPCCPWSDSLDAFADPVLSHFDKMGPGEQVAAPYDEGRRERRSPEPTPTSWPSSLTHRVEDALFDLPEIADATVVGPTVPYACPVGTRGVSSYILKPSYLTAFER